MEARRLLARLRHDQRGLRIIETTSAGLVIIVGVLGAFLALEAGARTTRTSPG